MAALWHIRMAFGGGAIFVALSEVLFYPVEIAPEFWIVVLAYALCVWLGVLMALLARAGRAVGLALAAFVVGLLVEGLPVFELYSALPFTILWTSMGWHGIVSGLAFWWLWRAAAARGGAVWPTVNLSLGLFLGLWGAYFWTAVDATAEAWAVQAAFGFALFFAGHAVLPLASVGPPAGSWTLLAVLLAMALAVFAVAPLPAVGLSALVLPLSVAAMWVLMKRARAAGPLWSSMPLRRWPGALLMPVGAVAGFAAGHGTVWIAEANWIVLLATGGVVLWVLLAAAAGRAGRPAGVAVRPSGWE